MPRIDAPTLAEHRDLRRSALLEAGRQILAQDGAAAVTMAAVGQRTGLSRPGVYEYFTSTDQLLSAVIVETLNPWSTAMADLLESLPDPMERLRCFIVETLRMRAAGIHVSAPSESAVPPQVFAEVQRHLTEVTEPLMQALEELDVANPERMLRMVQAVVDAAAHRIRPGIDPAAESDAACRFILAGVMSEGSADQHLGAAHRRPEPE